MIRNRDGFEIKGGGSASLSFYQKQSRRLELFSNPLFAFFTTLWPIYAQSAIFFGKK